MKVTLFDDQKHKVQQLVDCRHFLRLIIGNRSHLGRYRKMFPACQPMMLDGFMEPCKLGQRLDAAKASIREYAKMGFGLA
jgi:hypothetical protein